MLEKNYSSLESTITHNTWLSSAKLRFDNLKLWDCIIYILGKNHWKNDICLTYAFHDLREGEEGKGQKGIWKNTSSRFIYQWNKKNIWGGGGEAGGPFISVGFFAGGFSD